MKGELSRDCLEFGCCCCCKNAYNKEVVVAANRILLLLKAAAVACIDLHIEIYMYVVRMASIFCGIGADLRFVCRVFLAATAR
jgi:hypothetical protein